MMASLKLCTFIIILLSWGFSYSFIPYTEKCLCYNNSTLCQKCLYNITLRESIHKKQELMCCDTTDNRQLTKTFVTTTFSQVTIRQVRAYNTTVASFQFLSLDTFSIWITNCNLSQVKINIKPQNLKEINLSLNRLQYIEKGIFNGFFNLRNLILRKNELVNILEGSFLGLSRLESLDLSENNLTILANVFTPLKNLQHLNLSRNNIEFIQENYFNNWLLQHLDVSHNNLKKVAPGALQLLPNLARLLLTDNPHLGITQLDTQLLVGTGRRLQQIDASRTGLYQVPEAFTHSVRFLSLAGNRIFAVRCGDLDSYPLLQSLDFSNNKIVSVEDDSLGRLEMLLFLNLNDNLLTVVPKTLPDELKYLSINHNIIKNLTIPDFKNLPNLRILLLKSNKIFYLQDNVFDDLLSLEVLDLSNNPIKMLSSSTFDGPLSLKDLRLCNLNLSVPEKDGSFPMSSPESIQMLHLQSSPGLARQLLADSAALAALSHLQYLDLRMNNLTELRNDLFFYLVQLKTLRLQGNGINCSTQLWLQDWMYWNKSVSNGENCYYSSLESKEEVNKYYNCTYTETFTISESLPPVNLYSTEMINKLLRYYGYLNKTDKLNNGSWKVKNVEINNQNSSNVLYNHTKNGSTNSHTNNFIETLLTGTKRRHYSDSIFENHKNKSAKRFNTPAADAIINSDSLRKEISRDSFTSKAVESAKDNQSLRERHKISPSDKSEFSPFQSSERRYIQYIGMVAVCVLILIAVVLWVSFRLRYRRRPSAPEGGTAGDQIEVSNISGGVLW